MTPQTLVPTGKVFMIDGFAIPEVEVKNPGPYQLLVKFAFGKELVMAHGHNPTEVREAHERVSRNPRVIDRIELHDGSGCLETIWSRTWT